ncbi:MAG: iron ABC transporter permease [Candidatus Dactylopiibacterium sp.]|nr:iron ABC transporter permease [Candidatus Dactylopiibacterium sp.]
MTLRPPPLALALALAALGVPAALALSLLSGSAGWGVPSSEIFWLIRVPRVLAAFGTGAALALAGALIQLVTRNPLADPHVLGVTSGASLGAVLMLVVAGGVPFAAETGAVAGALGAMTLVFALAWRGMGRGLAPAAQPGTVIVLLVGVMVASAGGAGVSFLLAIADDLQLRNIVFWLLGDLNGAASWWPVWLALGAALLLAWPRAQELDWIARGDAWAWTLGVPVARRRRVAILAACLATGAAVATAGSIGFVGLVAPHIVRLTGLRHARLLLPFSALFGGVFLVLADTAARTLIAPAQLPVGVISAAVGVPLFLTLLLRRRP